MKYLLSIVIALTLAVPLFAQTQSTNPTSNPTPTKISTARSVTLGTRVKISGIVTLCLPDFFYIESIYDRTIGLRIVKSGHSLTFGKAVEIIGTISTGTDGERFILADTINLISELFPEPRPWGMSNRNVTDGYWAWRWAYHPDTQSSSYEWNKGSFGTVIGQYTGSRVAGLFVRVWGRITQIAPNGAYIYISDGSYLWDGTFTNGQKNLGIRLECYNSTDAQQYHSGQYVAVNGVSDGFDPGDGYLRAVVSAYTSDIQIFDE